MSLTIVIPAYSGEKTIARTIQSILNQKKNIISEVVLVIDGPNQQIKQIADEYIEQFASCKVEYVILQLPENVGVFRAILTGSEKARGKKILLVSDRMRLPAGYISKLTHQKQKIIIPTIEEEVIENPVSQALSLIRKKIYRGNKESYYIDSNNFEEVGKGTGGLYIDRELFIKASKTVEQSRKSTKNISDDTKLFRYIVNNGNKIYRSANLIAYYIPRETVAEEAMHVFRRGPKFVDYYLKPGTRFFGPLIACFIALPIVFILCIIYPVLLAVIAGLFILTLVALSILLARNFADVINICLGLPLLMISFGAGILKGTVQLLITRKSIK